MAILDISKVYSIKSPIKQFSNKHREPGFLLFLHLIFLIFMETPKRFYITQIRAQIFIARQFNGGGGGHFRLHFSTWLSWIVSLAIEGGSGIDSRAGYKWLRSRLRQTISFFWPNLEKAWKLTWGLSRMLQCVHHCLVIFKLLINWMGRVYFLDNIFCSFKLWFQINYLIFLINGL